MRKIKNTLFSGRLGRKHYLISILILFFIGGIATQIAREVNPGVYVFTFAGIWLIKTIFDAKRLRDNDVPGKIAFIAVIIFLFAWVPWTYDVMVGATFSYPTPHYVSLSWTLLFIVHLNLLFAKGNNKANRYGTPTNSLSLINALFPKIPRQP